MAALPDATQFKPKFLQPGGKTGSMADVAANMKSRGLKLIKRQPSMDASAKDPTDYDATAERQAGERLVANCRDIGLSTYECTPFVDPSSTSMEDIRKCSFFYIPIRFNSHQAGAKLVFVDMTVRQLLYIGDDQQPLGEAISLHGAKVDGDLVAKRKFHLWPKGQAHKPSVNHTLYGEDYRDSTVEVLKCLQTPDFPLLCIHEGPLSKRGKSGLTYTSRFGRLINGMLVLYANEKVQFPKEGVCLVNGPKIEKVSKNLIRITANERKYQLKFLTEQVRDLWYRGMEICRERVKKERLLMQGFNKSVAKELKKDKRRRNSLGHSLVEDSTTDTPDKPPSPAKKSTKVQQQVTLDTTQEEDDGLVDDEQGEDQDEDDEKYGDSDDDEDEENTTKVGAQRKPSPTKQKSASPKKTLPLATRTNARRTTGGAAKKRNSSSPKKKKKGAMSPQSPIANEEPKNFFAKTGDTESSNSRDDGAVVTNKDFFAKTEDEVPIASPRDPNATYIEVEVHLLRGIKVSSMGLLEVDENMTLKKFRTSVYDELDHIPDNFVFMSESGVVPEDEEDAKTVRHIFDDGVVIIKAVIRR